MYNRPVTTNYKRMCQHVMPMATKLCSLQAWRCSPIWGALDQYKLLADNIQERDSGECEESLCRTNKSATFPTERGFKQQAEFGFHLEHLSWWLCSFDSLHEDRQLLLFLLFRITGAPLECTCRWQALQAALYESVSCIQFLSFHEPFYSQLLSPHWPALG